MYERYDGQGFPERAVGQGDPARRAHPRGRRHLRRSHPEPAQPVPQDPPPVRGVRGARSSTAARSSIPNIVDLFRQAMTRRGHARQAPQRSSRGADHRSRSGGDDGARAPPDRAGLRGEASRAPPRRRASMLESGEIDVVVSEIDLEQPEPASRCARRRCKEAWGARRHLGDAHRQDRSPGPRSAPSTSASTTSCSSPSRPTSSPPSSASSIERRAASSRAARGVSGSLAEMSLPDMVQILWHGRKTCALEITRAGRARARSTSPTARSSTRAGTRSAARTRSTRCSRCTRATSGSIPTFKPTRESSKLARSAAARGHAPARRGVLLRRAPSASLALMNAQDLAHALGGNSASR